jgi:hypothetical protein
VVAGSQRRLGAVSRIVAAVFFVALAALPFAHHDLSCHLKSNTHCSVCHVGTSADPGGGDPALAHVQLVDAGRPAETSPHLFAACVRFATSDRAPPSSSGTLL